MCGGGHSFCAILFLFPLLSYFDAHGNYYSHSEKEIQDNWLDEVDWNKVT